VLASAIRAVRPGGVVSVPGVYGGPVAVDMGSIVQKGLTMRSGQTHVKRYLEPLTKLIQEGKVDMTSLVSHKSTDLREGPDLYKAFKEKTDGCTKVVFNLA
jgi:threonine dehydrogenase-like Zn-dependent dehydrogenase